MDHEIGRRAMLERSLRLGATCAGLTLWSAVGLACAAPAAARERDVTPEPATLPVALTRIPKATLAVPRALPQARPAAVPRPSDEQVVGVLEYLYEQNPSSFVTLNHFAYVL